jgi:long-chain fatty acid transport protein
MKPRLHPSKWTVFYLALLSASATAGAARAQFGTILSATGPVNRSMAGASTAAPLDAAGALYWNPATMSGLDRSEMDASAELLFPHSHVATSVAAGALGPGIPAVGLAGRTDSDTGAFPLPTIALAYRPDDSRLTFGLGIYAVAGFGVDYAGSTTNPLLTAPPPAGVGFGPVYSNFQVLQIHPAVSYQITDRLSVGGGPAVDLASLQVAPAVFAAPDDANGDGFLTYPQGLHYQETWGGGFDVGAYYRADAWGLGASFKSPQWFDKYRYNSSDELGSPRQLTFDLDLPLIVSVGAAYTGLDRWTFAADARYLDYADVHGFGQEGFAPDGAVRGVGWRSVFAVATGVQYQLTDAAAVRLGYSWNQNPVPAAQSFINTVSPLLVEHMISAGASWKVTENFTLSVAYMHAFENSIEGPLLTPAGPVPGTSVRNSASADTFLFGGSLKFGCPRRLVASENQTTGP